MNPERMRRSVQRLQFETQISNSSRGLILAVLMLLITAILWSIVATATDIARGVARVSLADDVAIVRNPMNGRIDDVVALHGSTVEAGDPLWTLDTREASNDHQFYTARVEQLNDRRVQTHSVIDALQAGNLELAQSSRRAYLVAQSHMASQRQLNLAAENAKAKWDYERSAPEAVRVESDVERTEREYQEALSQAEAHAANTLADLTAEIAQIDQEILLSKRALADAEIVLEKSLVQAPVNGTIEYLDRLSPGELILQGEDIARVVPESRGIAEIRIEVPASEAGRVRVGDPVRLELIGASEWEFGTLDSQVEYISDDAITGPGGQQYFEAIASIANLDLVGGRGRPFTLRSGMNAVAYIEVGTRPIYTFVFDWTADRTQN